MAKKIFTVLENNPEVLTQLAHSLGLSSKFAFYDVYSLTDLELLSFIPRPVYALLAIIPMTLTWNESRVAEDGRLGMYNGTGPEEPVIWFKQTITHGCGSIGMLHCTLNSPAETIVPGSELEKLKNDALPLKTIERAQLLADSEALYEAHEAVAQLGDTIAPNAVEADNLGQHFVAFVKGRDSHLYELEGVRKGPLDRGALKDDEDLLSTSAMELGLKRLIEQEKSAGGDLRFSCIALAPSLDD